MAGSGLLGIKRRIKSVTNTNKITKAMGLVATSKLRKAKQELDVNRLYSNSFSEILSDVLRNHEGQNVYMDGNNSKKKLYIVLTSDAGLCGAFNANIINKAVEEISKDKENSIIMVIGARGISYFNRFNYDVGLKYIDIPDIPSLGDVNDFAMAALDMYEKEEVGQISIVYARFISQAKQEIVVEKMLPLKETAYSQAERSSKIITLEPDTDKVLNDTIPMYMRDKMLNCLLHSKSSEQSTRMTAMDGATRNANELLDRLKVEYNRMRQSAITQEITEIVGGAEAQK